MSLEWRLFYSFNILSLFPITPPLGLASAVSLTTYRVCRHCFDSQNPSLVQCGRSTSGFGITFFLPLQDPLSLFPVTLPNLHGSQTLFRLIHVEPIFGAVWQIHIWVWNYVFSPLPDPPLPLSRHPTRVSSASSSNSADPTDLHGSKTLFRLIEPVFGAVWQMHIDNWLAITPGFIDGTFGSLRLGVAGRCCIEWCRSFDVFSRLVTLVSWR